MSKSNVVAMVEKALRTIVGEVIALAVIQNERL